MVSTSRRAAMPSSVGKLIVSSTLIRVVDSSKAIALVVLAAGMTANPLFMGMIPVLSTLPVILLGPFIGQAIDRYSPKMAYYVGLSVELLIILGGFIWFLTDGVSLQLCLVLAGLMGLAQTVTDNATSVILPLLANESHIMRANGLLSSAQGIARVVSPGVGSVLVIWNPVLLFALWLTLGACSLAIAALIHHRSLGMPATEGVTQSWSVGLRWLLRNRSGRNLLACVCLNNIAFGAQGAVLALFVTITLGLAPSLYGVVGSASALSAITGNALVAWVNMRFSIKMQAVFSLAMQALGFIVLAASISFPMALAGTMVLGFSSGIWNVASSTTLMMIAPVRIRGSVMATYRSLAFGGVPLGSALGGIGGLFGYRASLALVSVIGLVSLGASKNINVNIDEKSR